MNTQWGNIWQTPNLRATKWIVYLHIQIYSEKKICFSIHCIHVFHLTSLQSRGPGLIQEIESLQYVALALGSGDNLVTVTQVTRCHKHVHIMQGCRTFQGCLWTYLWIYVLNLIFYSDWIHNWTICLTFWILRILLSARSPSLEHWHSLQEFGQPWLRGCIRTMTRMVYCIFL